MTVASTLNRKEYAGNGATTAFATNPVIFFDSTDLEVYVVVTATGAAVLKTLTTHYTVSGGGGAVGTVTMLTAPTALETLVVVRTMPLVQSADFVNNDVTDAEVAEDVVDKLVLIDQQQDARIERSIRIPDSDTTGTTTEMPAAGDRANKFLSFDAIGNVIASAQVAAGTLFFTPTTQAFSGTGAQTAFTLSAAPGTPDALIVRISGVVQTPTTDYTVSGTTLTFTTAPAAGSGNVVVQNFGVAGAINTVAASAITGQINDSQVGVLLSASGAVTRTQESKNADYVSVFDFMTVAQIADVQAGTLLVDVRAALESAFASGAKIYIPPGTYRTSANIPVSAAQYIYGAGANNSIIHCTDVNADILTFPDAADFLYVEGITLQHPSKGTGNGLVLTNNNNDVTLSRVQAKFCNYGFQSKNVSFLQTYDQCRSDDCNEGFYTEGRTVGLTGLGTTTIYNRCYANRCNTGFHANGMKEIFYNMPVVDFNSSNTAPTCISVENSISVHVKTLAVEGTLGASGYGVRVVNSTVDNVVIDGIEAQVTATGFTWYLYSLATVTGRVKAQVSNITTTTSVDIREYSMQNSDGGAIFLEKRGNNFGTLLASDAASVAGYFEEKDWDDDLYGLVRLTDDFLGDVVADQWNARAGSDAQAVSGIVADQTRGIFRLTSGDDAAATMAVNGIQLESQLNWTATQYGLVMDVRLRLVGGITSCAWFFGFTDQDAALEMPFTLAAGDALTSNATDAVGVLFDTAADTDNWWLVGVKADVDATKQNTAVAPVSGTYERWRIEVSWSGGASFFRNGALIGTHMTNAVTRTTQLTPVWAGFARAGAVTRQMDIDIAKVSCVR